jgi:hypothetical protein
MKSKPNTDQFKNNKDLTSNLEGGAADAENRVVEQPVVARVHREQKVFRLPLDLINALKRETYERSMATGLRVTEMELVEKALRIFLKM